MDHLAVFVERAVLRLGGAFIPGAGTVRIETPERLMSYPGVARSYREAVFDRDLAMRRQNVQLLGLGHPLVDALIRHFQRPQQPGEITALADAGDAVPSLSVRALFHLEFENGRKRPAYVHLLVAPEGSWREADPLFDIDSLRTSRETISMDPTRLPLAQLRSSAGEGFAAVTARLRATTDGVLGIRHVVAGLAAIG